MVARFKGRNAQITVFMIVGIILLFSSALLFYIRNEVAGGIPEEFVPTIEEVPLEAQPIKIFVEDCVRQTAIAAIKKAGAHGGYVEPNNPEYGSVFGIGIEPTESDAIMLMDNPNAIIPYWWHMDSPNRCLGACSFQSGRPALYKTAGSERSIEGQIDTYIRLNLDRCLDGFRGFEEQGFTVQPRGEIEPDFKVAEKESIIVLDYPLRVSREGQATDISRFFTKVDVDLKKIYTLATEIVNFEINHQFLEQHTRNLIAIYSKPEGNDRLPPMGHFSMGHSEEFMIWTTTETRDRLQSYVLPPGIMMMQVSGTSNNLRHVIYDTEAGKYDRIATGLMDKTFITPNMTDAYYNLEARLVYLDWWPIYLNINDAEILKPQEVGPVFTGPLFDLLGMKRYRFFYDLSYPVMVSLTDNDAFNGDGLKFNFALEQNLRRNLPMNESFSTLPAMPQASYFCDVDQRNSGVINIEVDEMYTGEPIEDVRVDFIAGDEICFLGYTELDENNKTVFSGKFPIGFGEIRILKEEYVPIKRPFGTNLNRSANYSFSLMPFMSINATVGLIPLVYNGNGEYVVPPILPDASMSPRETAILSLKRIDDDEFGEYETFLQYNVTEGPTEMMLVPGTYEVEGSLILYQQIIIPAEEQTYEVPFSDDQVVEINRSVFDRWNSGGMKLDNVTGYMEISREDILDSERVEFKLLRFPLPVTHSRELNPGPDLEQVGLHGKYSGIYRHYLDPQWIS